MLQRLNPREFFSALLLITMLALALGMQGCAQMGIAAPQTFNDKIYVATSTVDQVQKTAKTLLDAKKISAEDGDNVLKATDAAVTGIAVARSYSRTNPAAGDAKLQAVLAGLALTQQYLQTQGGK